MNKNECSNLFAPLQTHFAEITIIGQTEGDGIAPCDPDFSLHGKITGGSLNINGNSTVRRTGSLSMIADDDNYEVTDADNPISVNKIINIRIGVSIDGTEDNADWCQLGVFVITGASVSRSAQGWNISVNIQDKMALLNGTCGGTLAGGITHSPMYEEKVVDGLIEYESKPVLFQALIESLLDEYAEGYADAENRSIEFGEAVINNRVNNTVRWTSTTPIYGEPKTINGSTVQYLSYTKPSGDSIQYNFNDNIGYQKTDFTFPGDLNSNIGDSVVSVLDKIKKNLGNFEYFFNENGMFIWREIPNGINQGSKHTNWADAISDSDYLTNMEGITTQWDFENDDIVISYSNQPQYSAIKNDFVCWGTFSDSNLPIRYRLVIDEKPSYTEATYKVEFAYDKNGVKRAVKKEDASFTVASTADGGDWREHMYLDYIANGTITPYAKELKEEWPKIYDVEEQYFYCIASYEGDEQVYNTQKFNSMPYYLDILDPSNIRTEDGELSPIAERLAKITVTAIGRRMKAIKDDSVNCIFNPKFSDTVYIPLGTEETAALRAEAIKDGRGFIQVPENIAKNIGIGSVLNSGFDAVRMMFNENTNYCNSITLQTLPLYFLDANDIISVEDDKSDIHGKYQIKSLSIPLTPTGPMSITASQVITLL